MFLKLHNFIESELITICKEPDFQFELEQFYEGEVQFITSLDEVATTTNYVVIIFEYLFNTVVTETITQLIKNTIQFDGSRSLILDTDLNEHQLQTTLIELDEVKRNISRFVFSKIFKIKKTQRLTKELLLRKFDEKIKVSRTEIATEFGIDPKTLNVWIKEIYGDKKFKGKELRFSEYLDLFIKFYISTAATSINLENNKDHFKNLLASENTAIKPIYSKSDIAEITSSNYKVAKNQLLDHNNFNFYKKMNVFPYSLAIQLIENMNGKK